MQGLLQRSHLNILKGVLPFTSDGVISITLIHPFLGFLMYWRDMPGCDPQLLRYTTELPGYARPGSDYFPDTFPPFCPG
jgi:hypothetical protein